LFHNRIVFTKIKEGLNSAEYLSSKKVKSKWGYLMIIISSMKYHRTIDLFDPENIMGSPAFIYSGETSG
jgi:hypothetical protein